MVKEENIFCGNDMSFGFVLTEDIKNYKDYQFVKVDVKYLKEFIKLIDFVKTEKIFIGIKDNQSILICKKGLNERIVFAIAPICED